MKLKPVGGPMTLPEGFLPFVGHEPWEVFPGSGIYQVTYGKHPHKSEYFIGWAKGPPGSLIGEPDEVMDGQ